MKNWDKIKSLLVAKVPSVIESLNEGLSPKSMNEFESSLEVKLPPSFKSFYQHCDGQRDGDFGFFFNWDFMSSQFILEEWNVWSGLAFEEGMNAEMKDSMSCSPTGCIQEVYFDRGWIPFATDHGGNYIAIDLNPGKNGREGQVILFGRDEDEKVLLAHDFESFMESFANVVKVGHYTLDEESGFVTTKDLGEPLNRVWPPLD